MLARAHPARRALTAVVAVAMLALGITDLVDLGDTGTWLLLVVGVALLPAWTVWWVRVYRPAQ